MFQIEQVTKTCVKSTLTAQWDPYDIPENSTFEDEYYIGGPGDQIIVQEWSDRKPARKCKYSLLPALIMVGIGADYIVHIYKCIRITMVTIIILISQEKKKNCRNMYF